MIGCVTLRRIYLRTPALRQLVTRLRENASVGTVQKMHGASHVFDASSRGRRQYALALGASQGEANVDQGVAQWLRAKLGRRHRHGNLVIVSQRRRSIPPVNQPVTAHSKPGELRRP